MSVQVASRSIPTSYLLKRLHTLTGVVPLGGFLIFHLWQNLSVLAGFDAFSERLKPAPLHNALAIIFVLIPLAVHVILGLLRLTISGNTLGHSRQGGNIRYLLQRVSAILGGMFLFWHIWHSRQLEDVQAWRDLLAFPGITFAYLMGGLAIIFHFCNGLWSAAMSVGLIQESKRQRATLYFVSLLFLILSTAFVLSLLRFSAPDDADITGFQQPVGIQTRVL